MKTSGATLLGAILLFLITGAAGAISVTIAPATQELGIGSTVTLAVVVSGLGAGVAPSLSTFDLDVAFDPGVLSFLDFSFGDPVLGDQLDRAGLAFTTVSPGAGTVNLFELSFDDPADLDALQAGSFSLGTLRFSAGAPGASAIEIAVNALGDAAGDPLPAELAGGRVAVVGAVGPRLPAPAPLFLVLAGLLGLAGFRARAGRRAATT